MHISSSYAKILGETNFHTREFPRSGSKAKDGEEKEKERKKNTPGTVVGPSGRDLTLAMKRRRKNINHKKKYAKELSGL